MPVFALAYLLDALHREGRDAARASTSCAAASTNAILPEGGSAHVEELTIRTCSGSGTRTSAPPRSCWAASCAVAADEALVQRHGALADAGAQEDGRWGNTQENALGDGGARRLLPASTKRRCPTSPRRGRLGNETLAHAGVPRPLDRRRGRRTMPMTQCWPAGAPAPAPLTFTASGTGTLFYTARLQYAVDRAVPGRARSGHSDRAAVRAVHRERERRAASTSFKAGDLIRVTLTLAIHEGAPLRRGHRSDARGLEPVESLVRDDGAGPGEAQDEQRKTERRWWRLVAARRLRSRRAPRRPRRPLRDAPRRGRAQFTLPRARDDRGHVLAPRRRMPRRCTSRRSSAARPTAVVEVRK